MTEIEYHLYENEYPIYGKEFESAIFSIFNLDLMRHESSNLDFFFQMTHHCDILPNDPLPSTSNLSDTSGSSNSSNGERERRIKPVLFKIKKENTETNETQYAQSERDLQNIHSKFCLDNILRKIKTSFRKFYIAFINGCIRRIYGFQKFKFRLGEEDNQNITIRYNKKILKEKMENVLNVKASCKYNDKFLYQNEKNIQKAKKKEVN